MTNIFYSRETTLGQNKVWNVKENTLEPLDQNGKPGIPYTFGKINSLIHIHRCKYVLVHVYVFETLSRTFPMSDQFDYECELYTFIGNFFRLLLHSSFNLGCFIFSDRIFDEHMTTYDLFQEIAKPIIDAAVQGFHGELVMHLWM